MYLTRSGVSTSRIFNTHSRVLYITSADLGLSSPVAQLGTPVGVHAWSVCVLSLQWSMLQLTGMTLLSWKPLPSERMNQVSLLLNGCDLVKSTLVDGSLLNEGLHRCTLQTCSFTKLVAVRLFAQQQPHLLSQVI